ncbi:hypothetical protein GeomeDRAFT_0211 [Geobacter metallireducens RCH3]|uniref:Uncharacterized protein n=1 Tax=Geobacter metallireducens (strain ATCC 53774 / DSM 7210 / GS-15) TaxID=269799 RepID=Q39VL4_GEOMG|nr:choice-of-anchor D domain-containing protein [Geobacter metallireducens]ABB31710.1 hypothetical protein Gmet_1476 [Geobacter metallireducens GS-15]EHP89413.1 hypothetical protein GeomeDRAFT_0211 [Geobacter metallireducens RCH3]
MKTEEVLPQKERGRNEGRFPYCLVRREETRDTSHIIRESLISPQLLSGTAATTLAANSFQDIPVTYLADVHGTQSASINMGFTYDGMTYSATNYLPLQGQAIYKPDFTGSYGFNYGTPYLANPVDGTVRLVNAGSQPLTVTGVSITGADAVRFQITGGNQNGNLSPGQYRDINVRYLANSVATHSANVNVSYTYDGVANTQDLGLSGQTLSTPVAQLWLDDTMIAERKRGTLPIFNRSLATLNPNVSSNFWPSLRSHKLFSHLPLSCNRALA